MIRSERGDVAPCASGKIGYASPDLAERDLRDLQAKAAAGLMVFAPTRAYFCPRCRYWHLTSRVEYAR